MFLIVITQTSIMNIDISVYVVTKRLNYMNPMQHIIQQPLYPFQSNEFTIEGVYDHYPMDYSHNTNYKIHGPFKLQSLFAYNNIRHVIERDFTDPFAYNKNEHNFGAIPGVEPPRPAPKFMDSNNVVNEYDHMKQPAIFLPNRSKSDEDYM